MLAAGFTFSITKIKERSGASCPGGFPSDVQLYSKLHVLGVPAMAQRVKNPTAGAGTAGLLPGVSFIFGSGLKDPVLLQLRLGFNPCLGIATCCSAAIKKTNKHTHKKKNK